MQENWNLDIVSSVAVKLNYIQKYLIVKIAIIRLMILLVQQKFISVIFAGKGITRHSNTLPTEIVIIRQRNSLIIDHPHIIATGHYAWYSENSLDELQKRAAQNMAALLRNETIEDSLN